jgi:hypothetical protein
LLGEEISFAQQVYTANVQVTFGSENLRSTMRGKYLQLCRQCADNNVSKPGTLGQKHVSTPGTLGWKSWKSAGYSDGVERHQPITKGRPGERIDTLDGTLEVLDRFPQVLDPKGAPGVHQKIAVCIKLELDSKLVKPTSYRLTPRRVLMHRNRIGMDWIGTRRRYADVDKAFLEHGGIRADVDETSRTLS